METTCIKCGVVICERNIHQTKNYPNVKYKKCKHCTKNNRSCFVIYEDERLYKIASENSTKLQRQFPRVIKENLERNKKNALRPEVRLRRQQWSKDYLQNQKKELGDYYVKLCLINKNNFRTKDITPELIIMKRKYLKLLHNVQEEKKDK